LNINTNIALSYYDKVTHPVLTEEAVIRSGLGSFIKEVLGFDKGIDQSFSNNGPNQLKDDDKTKTVLRWLRFGSTYEDVSKRAANHFYDPTRNEGLYEWSYLPSILMCIFPAPVWLYTGTSNKDWALGCFEDSNGQTRCWDICEDGKDKFTSSECNDYSYRKAKEAYLQALISCNNEEEQNTKFAIMFERLGRV